MLAYFKSTAKCTTVDALTENLTQEVPCAFPKWDGATDKWVFDRDKWMNEFVRIFRNARLVACDWTQLPDAPLTAEQKTAWTAYRQALRDLPNNESLMPENLVWPEVPC